MDQETLFTGSKWDILKLLEEQKLSPIELAKQSGTSTANISQQLRFLEMAGIVTSERLSNRDKGQPRILYSLAGQNAFLISTSPGFVEKKFIELSERRKAIMRIWFYERKDHQYYVEKAFLKLEEQVSKINALAVDRADFSNITITIFADASLKKPVDMILDYNGVKKTVKFNLVNKIQSDKERYYSIYDPQKLFGVEK